MKKSSLLFVSLLLVLSVNVGRANAVPDIRGEYSGSYPTVVSNCNNSSSNGTYTASLVISISQQTGNLFSGTATGTFNLGALTPVESIQLSGQISDSGQISGSTTHTFLDTAGEGTFTGQLSGNTLSIQNSGQDTSGDTCTYVRTMSATRPANDLVVIEPPTLSYTIDGVNLSVSWTPVSGATGYRLYYAPVIDGEYETISSKDMGASTTFNYTLWEGASFYIAVKAYNDQESSTYSNIEVINIETVSIPPEAPELSITITDLNLSLSWTEIPEATGYILSYAPTSSYIGPESFITEDVGGDTSFQAVLWDGASFTVAVQAYDAQSNSAYSNIEQFTITPFYDIDNDSDGYTENQGDCDDTTAAISPIAEEICGDGIDQDCSGSDEICTVSYPSGEYLAVIYQYEQGVEATAYSLISMDGSSSVLRQQMIIWPDILGQSVPANLELQPDGSYSMENGDHGYISQDQEVLIQSDTNPTDGDVNVTTNVKKSSGKTSADFSGQYYLVGYINETEYIWTDIYEMVCGQTGNCPFDQLMTSGPYPLESGSFDFTISSDGTMTFEEDEVKGIMSPDESFMAFGAGFMLDESQGSLFVTRKGSGMTNTDLKGKYAVVEYNNFPETNYLEFVFDGSGNVYYTGQYGSFGSPITGASTYTLAEDGFLTIHSFRGKTMQGALSSDKEEFAVVNLGDSFPGIMFGVK